MAARQRVYIAPIALVPIRDTRKGWVVAEIHTKDGVELLPQTADGEFPRISGRPRVVVAGEAKYHLRLSNGQDWALGRDAKLLVVKQP